MNRREFIITSAGVALSAAAGPGHGGPDMPAQKPAGVKTKVSLIKTPDRHEGVNRAIDLLKINPVSGKSVLLKPNFNTADQFPGSTHHDTLEAIILRLKAMKAKSITVGERSGPPDTADVMREKGIYALCEKHGVKLINFEELPPADWVRIKPERTHWRSGFDVARPVLDAECVVAACCLKTHAYGGVFTMSLKLAVGITHKRNMTELHTSFMSMRKMIAEINQAYSPALIVLDAIEGFVDKGPARGPKKRADVIVAGTDRIAIDAVGLAILKELGSNKDIMDTRIFDQEQMSRAVELGLGVGRPEDIELVTDDAPGKEYAERIRDILLRG